MPDILTSSNKAQSQKKENHVQLYTGNMKENGRQGTVPMGGIEALYHPCQMMNEQIQLVVTQVNL